MKRLSLVLILLTGCATNGRSSGEPHAQAEAYSYAKIKIATLVKDQDGGESDTESDICESCNGSGKLGDGNSVVFDCDDCNGTGRVSTKTTAQPQPFQRHVDELQQRVDDLELQMSTTSGEVESMQEDAAEQFARLNAEIEAAKSTAQETTPAQDESDVELGPESNSLDIPAGNGISRPAIGYTGCKLYYGKRCIRCRALNDIWPDKWQRSTTRNDHFWMIDGSNLRGVTFPFFEIYRDGQVVASFEWDGTRDGLNAVFKGHPRAKR